jgi:hypothetical protein
MADGVWDATQWWAPILIAVAALGFTVLSFWWMNWRVGRLLVTAPRTYAGTTQQDKLILLFPFVFYNTGPVPHVVRDLRVRFRDEPNGVPLSFQRVRSGVSPSHSSLVDLSAAFPVPGNEVVRMFCEFERSPVSRAMDVGSHPLILEVLTDRSNSWQTLLAFDLNVNGAPPRPTCRDPLSHKPIDLVTPRARGRGRGRRER